MLSIFISNEAVVRLIIVLSMFIAFSSSAEVEVSQNFVYYPVNAESNSELSNAVLAASPIKTAGRIQLGHTDYSISWSFWPKKWNRQCRIDKTKTLLKIQHTMPKLVVSTAEVQNAWASWYPRLLERQYIHADIAKKTAEEIDAAILYMGSRTNCKILEQDANQLANEILAKGAAMSFAYDQKTRHGESEKALLASFGVAP